MKTNKQYLFRLLLLFILCFSQTQILAANSADSITKAQGTVILRELKDIRSILERIEKKTVANQRKPLATTGSISTKNRPVIGNDNAPITIVEVSDYQCTYCKRFFMNTYHKLKYDYIDTGKVRLVFKDLPLDFHVDARKAAQAAHCSGDQGKYWDMHDLLFGSNKKLNAVAFTEHASQLGLNVKDFNTCISSSRHMEEINTDISHAQSASLSGTPSFIFGKTNKDIISGEIIRGAQSYDKLRAVVEKLLKI